MTRPMVCILTMAALLTIGERGRADDALPPPRVMEMPPGYVYDVSPFARRSAYEVWQNYGVDRRGFFRPLVVYSPFGAYYRYNGAPFPWTTTHQREFMPYVVD